MKNLKYMLFVLEKVFINHKISLQFNMETKDLDMANDDNGYRKMNSFFRENIKQVRFNDQEIKEKEQHTTKEPNKIDL